MRRTFRLLRVSADESATKISVNVNQWETRKESTQRCAKTSNRLIFYGIVDDNVCARSRAWRHEVYGGRRGERREKL